MKDKDALEKLRLEHRKGNFKYVSNDNVIQPLPSPRRTCRRRIASARTPPRRSTTEGSRRSSSARCVLSRVTCPFSSVPLAPNARCAPDDDPSRSFFRGTRVVSGTELGALVLCVVADIPSRSRIEPALTPPP